MSIADTSDESCCEGISISLQEFWRSELLTFYSSALDTDLILVSNRNLRLKQVHAEFLKFSRFITEDVHKDKFQVFLIPVFLHLYVLLLSNSGKSHAKKFYLSFHRLPFPSHISDNLLLCETHDDARNLIKSYSRIRVKLSRSGYRYLMEWFRECFSNCIGMFNVLRVLHENFLVDICHDTCHKELLVTKEEASIVVGNWFTKYNPQEKSKESENAAAASNKDDDVLTQKMSELEMTRRTPGCSGSGVDYEGNSPMFKLRNLTSKSLEFCLTRLRGNRFLELIEKSQRERNSIQDPGSVAGEGAEKGEQQMDIVADPGTMANESIEKGEQQMDIIADPGTMANESIEKGEEKMDFFEDPGSKADESAVKEVMEELLADSEDPFKEEAGTAARLSQIISEFPLNASDVDYVLGSDSSPLDLTAVSPEDSEYLICSEASTEKNDEDEFQPHENIEEINIPYKFITLITENYDEVEPQGNVDDQDLNDEKEENGTCTQEKRSAADHTVTQENADKDKNDVTPEGAKKEEHRGKIKTHKFEYKNTYKTDFHVAYPITISGKDIICSADICSDLHYMAISFESCKICTWKFAEADFAFQLIGTLTGHKETVYALSINSEKKCLVSGSQDSTVRIWDLETSICLKILLAHTSSVLDVCISPNSKYFLSASEDMQICLFWFDDTYPIRIYSGHSLTSNNRVRFHPNSTYFASASADGIIFLFKVNLDNRPVRMLTRHNTEVFALSFSPCGRQLASADILGTIIIWDIIKYSPSKILQTGQGIRSLSYDNSGSFIAALFYHNTWKIYNVEGNNKDVVIEAESIAVPKSLHFSINNNLFIIQHIEGEKKRIAERKGRPITRIRTIK